MERNNYTKEQLINIIQELKLKNFKFNLQTVKFSLDRNNRQIYQQINLEYPNVFKSAAELYRALNCDINELFCKHCGKRVDFIDGKKHREFCSLSCKAKYVLKIGKVINPSLRSECVAKRNKTFQDKYGCNPSSLPKVQKKREETFLKRHGVKFPGQVESGKIKAKQTNLQKYGVDNYTKTKEYKDKTRQTCLNKYGVDNYTKTKEYKDKTRQTCLNKYGVDSAVQVHIKNYNLLTESYVKNNFINDGYFLVKEFCDFYNIQNHNTMFRYKSKFSISYPNKLSIQKMQQEVYKFIQDLGTQNIIYNDKIVLDGKELDIYIPDRKLAIEFDGLMFHSFGKSKHIVFNNFTEEDQNIHLVKTLECEKKEIQLLHIFENEWLNKQDIWKSIIRNKLGLSSKIYARKCRIKLVDFDTTVNFLQNNHLQGSCISKVNIGLYYKDELVSIMTFGKSRFNKEYDWELLRFCNKLNISVVGGASKLLKYFRKHYLGSIVSYANRRWSNGNLYRQLGFKNLGSSEPNYFYFTEKDRILFTRIKFQKHKLSKLLTNFDNNLTETQNMYNNNYRKIYDCGNRIYTIK